MLTKLITVMLLFGWMHAVAQCPGSFFSLIYKTPSFNSFTDAATFSDGTMVATGNIRDDHGMIAKFSANGRFLFSYQYNPIYQYYRTFYKTLQLTAVLPTRDGSMLIGGNVIVDRFANQNEYLNKAGVLVRSDGFGNILWSKIIQAEPGEYNSGFDLAVSRITETNAGDIIVYLSSDYNSKSPAYGKLLCFSSQGKLKWKTVLNTPGYDGGHQGLQEKRSLTQAKNGSIIVGDMVTKIKSTTSVQEASLVHFFSVDARTGSLNWEQFYEYPPDIPGATTDIISVSELQSGNFSFAVSNYALSGGGVRIETNGSGKVQRSILYLSSDHLPIRLIDACPHQSFETYLFSTPNYSGIATVDDAGIVWQKGFNNANGLFPANCITGGLGGYGIFMSNFNSSNMRLVKTDSVGLAGCVNTSFELIPSNLVLQENNIVVTKTDLPDPVGITVSDFPMQAVVNPFATNLECENIVCCTDVVDSINVPTVHICEGSRYRLPDNTVVSRKGTYYVIYKTRGGCDSIKFYHIEVDKNPGALTLGDDLCIQSRDSFVLHASGGYEDYTWMNSFRTPDSSFTIKQQGSYWVSVSNSCGSKTDTVNVYENCDFPVYIPNAFSPNNDGKNDIFMVPAANKNKFVSLQIFNRWGQLLFSSEERSKGWDGRFGNSLQPTGIYVYKVEMKTLTGKNILKSGTVLLIR